MARLERCLLRNALAAAIVLSAVCGAQEGPVVIYTKEKPPAAPKLEVLPLKESATQDGITWTFDKPARVGLFVNGDQYVVGPVTVTALDPKPLYGNEVPETELDGLDKGSRGKYMRNGSMLNPPPRAEMAYDSGIRNWYRPDLAAKLPIAMKPGDSLVSTISLKLGEKASFAYHSEGLRAAGDNCPIKIAAVLTCVAEPQPPDAFRPSYGDRQQKIYLARNLRRDLLPKLAHEKDVPDPAKFAEVFRRPWLNTGFFGFDQPMENMPHYGQWVGQSAGNAGLMLCLDFPPDKKEPLLLNFVQVGIDYWGLVRAGHPGWQGWGGHGSGRKFPIVFGGFVLDDPEMASPTKAFPKANFGEDNQTRYGDCWSGAKVVFAGHSGIQNSGKVERPQWGPYEHLNPSDWDKEGQKNWQSECYRRANTSCCWVAEALAMRILKLEKQWNHDAFFDYVDRWMTEDDKEHRQVLGKRFGDKNMTDESKSWCHQGYTGDRWVKDVWTKHRSASSAPTDGWKKARPNAEEAAKK